jgi:predicted transcriptional regulator
MPELTKYITDLAERATAEIKSKDPKKLSIAETLELLKKGLKPYFYDQRSCSLTELTLDNEDRAENIKWIHPKMAEKINERYREIEALEEDLEDYTVKVEAKIKDLRSRISDIEEKGTDLLI